MTGVRGLLLLAVLSAGSPVTGGLLAAAAFGKPLPEDSSCELIGANGEVTVNLAGGQIESCSFADDFNRLLYVPRAGYRYGTDPFKHGGVALVRKAGAPQPSFSVVSRRTDGDVACLELAAEASGRRISYRIELGPQRLTAACDEPDVVLTPYFCVSDAQKVVLRQADGKTSLADEGLCRTIVLDGGWKVVPVKAVDPVTNIHPLEAPAYVRLEPTDETARRQLSVRVTGRRPVPSPTAVADVTKWKGRRAELRALFEREVYGFRPAERPDDLRFEPAEPDCVMMDGQAVRKRIRASWKGPHADYDFTFTAFVPNRPGPHPSFLLICNRDPKENIDPTRWRKSDFWPAEEIVRRGYAALAFWNGDIAPDDKSTNFVKGVYRCWRKDGSRAMDSWGALSAWAWGASRVMDWIETEPTLDARHVAVVGHSRGGKTALLAGAFDERFAMCCPNDAGMSGDKLNHIDLPEAETVAIISKAFPHWFCGNYAKYAGRDREMSFDQHELIALVAPRLVAIGSASRDFWAGQLGQYYAARLASPMWEAMGAKGLEPKTLPAVIGGAPVSGTCLQEGSLSFHCRPGGHNLTSYDWARYMDFADRHGWLK